MVFFKNQLLNVIEWNETRPDIIFWKWRNSEIKKGSRLIIKPGQDAIFLHNGKIEGVFSDEGNYEIETQIVPFLSTLKGFKFGFNSGLRAEVLFVNIKEFLVRWGTKNPINIPSPRMPGGIPIRSFGTFSIKVNDYLVLIDKIAGVKPQFAVDDVKERTLSLLDQLLMKWIVREGKDMFNLQANAFDIAKGIKVDLDMELLNIGLTVTDFNISSFTYPEQIQKMIEKNASYEMVGDVSRYQNIGMMDAMKENPGGTAAGMAQMGAGLTVGMQMANQMSKNMSQPSNNNNTNNSITNDNTNNNTNNMIACKNCGFKVADNINFCSNCGNKIEKDTAPSSKQFCQNCGGKLDPGAKFCSGCGEKV
ncbi:UNVERIFIED_CONTAM: membrane protease subunit (stomatin/prohibitin family) [Acetivibrio alkalicellulosi]